MKLTTHLHLVPRPRMRGAVPPLPITPSWTTLPLPFTSFCLGHSIFLSTLLSDISDFMFFLQCKRPNFASVQKGRQNPDLQHCGK
jgi:hypothetical protein